MPVALFQLPDEMPGWKALASVAALGIIGTAVATLILYRMLVHVRLLAHVARHVLLPPIALFYGVTILDESLHPNAVAGLVLILAGWRSGRGS